MPALRREEEEVGSSGLAWTSWPVRDRAGTLWLILPVCVAALGAVYIFAGELFWVVCGALLLGLGLREYFFPVRYRMDPEGVTIHFWLWTRHRPWSEIKRVAPSRHGVFLSPFPRPNRLENHRGLFLRFAGNRREVMGTIQNFLDLPGGDERKTSSSNFSG